MSDSDYKTEDYKKDPLHIEFIKHSINNIKPLTKEQLNIILQLPEKRKNEIIVLYNNIIEYIQSMLETY